MKNNRVDTFLRAGIGLLLLAMIGAIYAGIHERVVVAGDTAPFEELIKVLAKPFEDQPEFADYATPPKPEERVCQTFCGT